MKLSELQQKHDKAYSHGEVTREQASDDLVFSNITQWDDNLLSSSQLAYRGQFDITRKARRQILSSLDANPVQIDFEPKATSREDGADLLDGLYRSDDRVNSSIEAYKIGKQESVDCGFGAWLMYADFESTQMGDFNQVIRRKPLYEANNKVFWDPNAKLQDKSDAMYCSVLHAYSPDGYKAMASELTGTPEDEVVPQNFKCPEQSYVFPWYSQNDVVYVSEFFQKEKVKDKVLMLQSPVSGELVLRESDIEEIMDDLMDDGFDIVAEKDIERWQVKRYLASGYEILDESVIAGENIPVIPIYGERAFVEDEEYYEGIVRLAKDPQRLRNFQLSYLADIVSRSPRQKPIFYPEQIQGFEDMYEENGADSNYPYLLQNPMTVNGEALPAGVAGVMPEQPMPQSLVASIQLSREAVEDVANPGLPQSIADPDLSGKAIYALQNRLDQQTMVYQESFKHAKRRDAEIYASMAKEIYSAPREVTLTLPDGRRKKSQIMEVVIDQQTGEPVVLNDLTNIEFDVFADISPAYSSQKEQTREEIKELMSISQPGTPEYDLLLTVYLNMIDGIDVEVVRDYAHKKLILGGHMEPETEEDMMMLQQAQVAAQQPNPQTQALMAEGQARIMEGQAALQNEVNDANKIKIDAYNAETKRQETIAKAQEAGVRMDKLRVETVGQQIDNARNFMGQ